MNDSIRRRVIACAMLAAAAMICIPGGLYCWSYHRKSTAIRLIGELDGVIIYAPSSSLFDSSSYASEVYLTSPRLDLDVDQWSECINAIGNLTSIEQLVITGPLLSDAQLQHVGRLVKLKSLSLHGCSSITDRGIAHLKALVNMESLNLSQTSVSDSCLTNLSHLELKSLNVDKTGVTAKGLKHLSSIRSLEDLRIDLSDASDGDLEYLGMLHDLVSVDLGGCNATDEGLKHLGALDKLQTLRLLNTNISGIGLKSLPKGLRELILTGTRIRDADICEGARFAKLEGLWLDGTEVTGITFDCFVRTPLQTLSLARTPCSDIGLESVAKMASLVRLDLSETRVTDIGISRLSKLSRLRTLTLLDTSTSDSAQLKLCREVSGLRVHPLVDNLSKNLPNEERPSDMLPRRNAKVDDR